MYFSVAKKSRKSLIINIAITRIYFNIYKEILNFFVTDGTSPRDNKRINCLLSRNPYYSFLFWYLIILHLYRKNWHTRDLTIKLPQTVLAMRSGFSSHVIIKMSSFEIAQTNKSWQMNEKNSFDKYGWCTLFTLRKNKIYTVWNVSKYGVFSGPYLDTFHAVEWKVRKIASL